MKRHVLPLLAIPIASGCARAPVLHERPLGVPAEAVLVPGEGMLAGSSVWVSCSPPSDRAPRDYICSVYPLKAGANRREGPFTLMLGRAPASSENPAPTPASLRLLSYDGFMLRVQEPWVLVPDHSRADPPLPTTASPATGVGAG
jgi:hypothetical protein